MVTARRSRKPQHKSVEARYDAAGVGRRVRGWMPASSGPNRAIEGLQRIRDRARDSTRNDWAGESSAQKWTSNLVGVGITPRWKVNKFTEVWDNWHVECDADGVLDGYGIQALGVRSWLVAGEVFMRRRPRSLGSPLSQPLQVQLIEAEFCPLFDADQWPGMPAGNTIRQGIERNKFGKRVAYWMYREHPGDKPAGGSVNPTDLIRILASEISHVYLPLRPGQLRGVSILAPVLVKMRSSMDFEDAVLDRQKLANLFVAFLKREMPKEWADIEFDPLTGLPKFYDTKDGKTLAPMEPGMTQELQPGESVEFANPPESGTTYPEYMRTTHMGTAAGQGLPYELFAGDIKDVSDRTLRVIINEFRRLARQRQWHTVIPLLCRPMVQWLGEAAVLNGKLTFGEYDQFVKPEWAPEGWEYIHPVQDVEGKVKARDAGLVSTSQIIAERGDDPAKVLEQIKADEASGLTPKPPVPAAAPGAKSPKASEPSALESLLAGIVATQQTAHLQAASAPAAAPTGMPEMLQTLIALVQASQAQSAAQTEAMQRAVEVQAEAMRCAVEAIAKAMAAQPIAVHVPAANVDVHVPEQPAPVVNVAPAAAAVDVHVQPTPVQITNDVKPADVTVDVNLPDRQITSEITREGRPRPGDITKVVQTETTVTTPTQH